MRKGLALSSFKSALYAALVFVSIMGVAYWAFELGLYRPNVVKRGEVTLADGRNRVAAPTRLLQIGARSLWQVEVAPGVWTDCGQDCGHALRKALAK